MPMHKTLRKLLEVCSRITVFGGATSSDDIAKGYLRLANGNLEQALTLAQRDKTGMIK